MMSPMTPEIFTPIIRSVVRTFLRYFVTTSARRAWQALVLYSRVLAILGLFNHLLGIGIDNMHRPKCCPLSNWLFLFIFSLLNTTLEFTNVFKSFQVMTCNLTVGYNNFSGRTQWLERKMFRLVFNCFHNRYVQFFRKQNWFLNIYIIWWR